MNNKETRDLKMHGSAEPRGSLISRLRKRNGWTQEYLAKVTGYSKLYILQLEAKRIPNPSIKAFAAIAYALSTTLEALWKDYGSI